jgi:hypothetical protein
MTLGRELVGSWWLRAKICPGAAVRLNDSGLFDGVGSWCHDPGS